MSDDIKLDDWSTELIFVKNVHPEIVALEIKKLRAKLAQVEKERNELQVWIERFASISGEDSGETPEIIFESVEEMIGNIRAIFPEQIAEDLYEAMDGESHWDDHDCDLEQLHEKLTAWKRLAKAQELVEKWRSTEKTHNGVKCHAWKVCADEIDEVLKGEG